MATRSEFADLLESIKKQLPSLAQGAFEQATRGGLHQQNKSDWRRNVSWLLISRFIVPRLWQSRQKPQRRWQRQSAQPANEGLPPLLALVIGVLGGAALMYLFDPDRGAQRRASLREQATRVAADVSESVQETTERVRDEVSRVVSEAEESIEHAADQLKGAATSTADLALDALVRAEVGRSTSDPASVEVEVKDGVVTLSGKVLASEAQPLVENVQAVPGVVSVQNRLEIHDAPES
ncbi:MAG: YtxH domain-containing protein [Anaerolineae bacterium]|nr:YtxH domain-containing protein [Anaerolineae bacterium]